jgi:hypothetical protein
MSCSFLVLYKDELLDNAHCSHLAFMSSWHPIELLDSNADKSRDKMRGDKEFADVHYASVSLLRM